MDLDASRKAQLVVFIHTLLNRPQPKFPIGYVAHMIYLGTSGTYVYMHNGWKRIG